MNTSIFVVSDLHLGGKEGFRMCEAGGRERLAKLFRWIGKQASSTRKAWIVVAGDIVDFLAEEPFEAFTADENVVSQKLEAILSSTAEVWDALAEAAKTCNVTLMLGNHDVELSMIGPRRRLAERVGGRVEFLFGNEAFTFGELLIEHGNRYDGWNIVDHNALRELHSRSSRGEQGDAFPTQPGSELVARIMNEFKKDHPWVDLLKPETAGVVPILAALGRSSWRVVAEAAKIAAAAGWRGRNIDRNGNITSGRFVSADIPLESEPDAVPVEEVSDLFALLEDAAATRPTTAPETSLIAEGAVTFDEELLFRALRRWGDKDGKTFKVGTENKSYLRAARTLVERGKRKVVLFGHTHHAKRIPLESGQEYPLYLNTGTWADLIRIPERLLDPNVSDGQAREEFRDFVLALKTNVASLRRLVPTFARIDFDEADNLLSADVLIFHDDGRTVPIDDAAIAQLLQ